jgi:quinol monooxygenase YgiN
MTKQEADYYVISESMACEERDKLAILERWTNQTALDAHAQRTGRHTPFRPELRAGNTEREDNAYNRAR